MEEILSFSYEDEMKDSFRDYAVSVIVSRALPDVRDGFKPVHRRVLYAMKDLGVLPKTPYKKSARIVGEVIGKYHPHGDSAVYETMVRLSQDFRMKAPLVDGHGNFGSIDGDGAAAMRYTEARLSPISNYLLDDLEKNVVDFRENYDGTETEPALLPTKFPQLLVNGYMGIAVGMKGSVPTHNIEETINAFLAYTKKKNITMEELLQHLQAPDYPTGGIIINPEELKEFYRTGEGKAVIRSKIEIEDASYGKKNVVVTEIPYTMSGNKGKLVNDITAMVIDKKLNEVTDVRDESSKDGIRIVLEVKKGVNIDRFLQKLYTKTKLQDTDSYQFLALVDGKPTTLSLLDYFQHYLNFQKEINTRKYQYLLRKGLDKKEILDGLIKAVDQIDAIVDAIRGSSSIKQMKDCLINGDTKGVSFRLKKHENQARKFSFSDRQAQAILDMKLQRLGALEVNHLKEEYQDLLKSIEGYEKILKDEKELLRVIQKEHQEFKKKFSVPRKTLIKEMKNKKYIERKQVEKTTVLIDRFGYAKTNDGHPEEAEIQEMSKDYVSIIPTDTEGRILIFTNKGNLYQVKVQDIPKGKKKDKGITLQGLSGFERGEHIVHISDRKTIKKDKFLFITAQGLGKIVEGNNLISVRKKVVATKLDTKDSLTFVSPYSDIEKPLLIQTKKGFVLKTKISEFSEMNKNAKGVTAIALQEEDIVHRVLILETDKQISINGKKVETAEFAIQKRAGKGKMI